MVKFISLHYQSGAEFHLNPNSFAGVEHMPAEGLTRVDIIGQPNAYKCVESPEEIQRLIDLSTSSPPPDVRKGVGVSGPPVYGDGTDTEVRSSGSELGSSGRGEFGRGDTSSSFVAQSSEFYARSPAHIRNGQEC